MLRDAPTALLADDEPLLRQGLTRMLLDAWPELDVIACARNGREAVELFEQHRPDICLLDVQMPGLSGIDAARAVGGRAHIVFVTAFSDYALEAFDAGALDYLVKPVDPARLADTVSRLKDRMAAGTPQDMLARLEELAARLDHRPTGRPLRRLKALIGTTIQLIEAERIVYLRSEEKYTVVTWQDQDATLRESLIRMPLKELIARLDPEDFVQVHRSYAVNLACVERVSRNDNETGTVHLRGLPQHLPVSRSYMQVFRHM